MPRYDDDLFKKLNKEKPLVKQMETPGPALDGSVNKAAVRNDKTRPLELLNTQKAYETPPPKTTEKRSFKEYGAPKPRNAPMMELETESIQPKKMQELKTDFVQPEGNAARPRPRPREVIEESPKIMPTIEKKPQRSAPVSVAQRPIEQSAPLTNARYELNAAAQKKTRSFRHEMKYYLNTRDYELLRAMVASLLVPDKHSLDGGYHIRSLYFDDYENSGMHEKISGVQHRKKYRIRIYNKSDDFIRLERKFKDGQYVSKDSVRLYRDEYERILERDYSFLLQKDSQLAHDFYRELMHRGSKPAAVVDYYREAFVHHVEDVRITFDTDLRTAYFSKDIFDPDLQTMPMFDDGLMVMEVKYNRYLPVYIKAIINNAGAVSRSAVSKYVICRKYE
jgi:hypothetical protein